jgi:hypothetical protein
MGNKISRVVVALLIGISFPILTGNQVVSAAPAVSGVLGESCKMLFQSRVIAADSTLTTEIAGVCFPSLNNPDKFVWSKDNNQIPSYTLVTDNDGKIAFGRNCVIINENDCTIPDPKPSGYLDDEPFVRAYPDTRYYPDNQNQSRSAETFGGLWFSETYISNIVRANYVAPEAVADVEDTIQVGGPISSQVVSSTLLIGLAAAVSLTSAAGSSSSQPSRSESSEAPELLRARKERRFAHANRFGRVFLGSVISMDRWAFFTKKLPAIIRWFGKFSSTAATSIGDADYLRAVLGIFSMSMYPVAIVIGIIGSLSTEDTMPIPASIWLTTVLILGCFDSLAGAISALTFIALTFVTHLDNLLAYLTRLDSLSTFTTNLRNFLPDILIYLTTLAIIFIITTGPGLFAGALRRFDGVHTHRSGKWERLVDFALSPIVTAWVVWKGLELLPKIIDKNIPDWSVDIQIIAAIICICIFVRYILEGYVAKHFADRINEIVTESVPIDKRQKIRVLIFKAIGISGIAYVLLVEVAKELTIGSILILFFLLLTPAIALAFGIKPKDKISKFNIIGTPRLAILLCAGLILIAKPGAKGVQFMTIAFTPVLYFILMEALAESHLKSPAYFYQNRNGRLLYQLSSVLLYILILGIMTDQFFELEKISKFLS